jgi:hypothetical protein
MRLIVELFERFYVAPREKRLGRELTRSERARGAVVLTSPLWLFVICAIVKNLIAGTLHW